MKKRILAMLLIVAVAGTAMVPAMELRAEESVKEVESEFKAVSTPVVKDGITYTYNTKAETYKVTKIADAVTDAVILSEIEGVAVTELDSRLCSLGMGANPQLVSVTIPDSIQVISDYAFDDFITLENIKVASTNPVYCSVDGMLYSKDMKTLYLVPPSTPVTVLNVPNGVKRIKGGACLECKNLMKINIPASVTEIGDDTYDYVSAFNQCSNATEILVDSENKVYSAENGMLFNKDKTILYSCISGITGMVTIPDTVVEIKERAFLYCTKITKVHVPKKVKKLGYKTFQNCTNLKEVILPEGLEIMDDDVFYSTGLENIVLPKSLKTIGFFAFFNSVNLKEVIIPENVTEICRGAFGQCESLKKVTILNPECVISDMDDTFEKTTIICGYANSTAQAYAEKNHREFQVYTHIHDYRANITKEATCTTKGIKTYTCAECGNLYTESVPAKGHTYHTDVVKATRNKNGSIIKKCSSCGNVESKTIIYEPKSIKLSAASYTNNGKTQKPTVIVKDSKGKKLKKNTDYTLHYAKGCKNVGKYTVTVKFKGNYSGTIKKTFTIKPKSTSLSKLSTKKKGFSAKWKKQTSQTSGYELQYSTNMKFKKKSVTNVTVNKNKTTSKSISKLKAKKKYYVRIRTYKTVKVNGKSTKIYSDWSKVKSVKTK